MITTAAADTLAGLFAGAPATGDHAVTSGVAFGQVLSASADMPVAPMTPLISRTMPGIATLPIGTLMGTGSLPFQASTLPSALAWSGTSVPVTTGGTMPSASQPMALSPPTAAIIPITSVPSPAVLMKDASLAAAPSTIEPAGQGMPVIDPQSSMTTVPFTMVGTSIKSAPLPTVVTDRSLTDVPPATEKTERRIPVIERPSSMTTVPFMMVNMPIKAAPLPPTVVTDGSLIAAPPSVEPAGRPVPVMHEPSMPIASDTLKAPIPARTAPVVEALLPEIATFDPPASTPAKAETATATPTTDGGEAPLPPASVGKVERPVVATDRLTGSTVAPTFDTVTASPADPAPVAPNETALAPARAASGKGNSRRAEAEEIAPDRLVAISVDPLAMPSPAPMPAAMPSGPSGRPVITGERDGPMPSVDDRSDSADHKPVEGWSSGAVPLPAEMVVAPIKMAPMAAGKPVAAAAPSAHPAIVPPSQTDAASLLAGDIGKTTAPDMATSAPHVGNAVREEGRMTETGPVNAQPASFANLVTHTEKTAAPAPTAAAPAPPPEPRVAAQLGRIGQEMGVAIARHAATGGGEAMTVRLDPVEFGRIEVTLSFDDSGTIRAVVAAESPAALDLLRRDSADLGRSLAEAGIRSDAQSFRFDTRQGSADGSGQGGQRWQQQSAAGTRTIAQATDDNPEPVYRPLRTQGRVDLMA